MATAATQGERKYIDCSEYPSDKNCTLRISGKEDEVLQAAADHAAAAHGHENTPEFREQLRGMLKDEPLQT
jgi:predicted small metal-binding protein